MATTTEMIKAQLPLAEFAYQLKIKYELTYNLSHNTFMNLYNNGEIQLSSVFENLFVKTRNVLGKPTKLISHYHYDFVSVQPDNSIVPLGDMKTTVLTRDRKSRRFVIDKVQNKIGNIYTVAWNNITNKPNFFVIPPKNNTFPKCGIKIMVHPTTGEKTSGYYNDLCCYNSWENMTMVDV